ncbi:MAG: peptidoglycan DD-metalloendopeptidase family protein [Bacteroidales bacterium]|nr:peptidoglycan DD-metalloendopeptidase family protein [Bacteroidales bacterium]
MRHTLRHICMLVLALFVGAMVANAQTVTAKKNKKERLEKEIQELDRQLKANSAKNADATYSLSLTRKKIASRRELIEESDAEIAVLDGQVGEKQHELDSLQARLDTMTFYYDRLVRSAYKNRDARVWYMYIIGSENIGQGLRRFSYLKNLSREMNSQGEKIMATRSEVEAQKAELEQLRAEANALRQARVKEVNQLKSEEASSEKIISQLKKDKSRYQNQLAAKRREVASLNREIQKLIAEQVKGGSKGSKKSSTKPIDYTLSNEFSANKGKLPWPVEGPVVESFGPQYHPVYKNLRLPDSDGISIAVAPGTSVKAVFNGEVKKVIVMQGYNKCVLVQHGSYFTFYCKLGSVSVKAGDKVKTGDVIGSVDAIGGSSQLHFQLWESSQPSDPQDWLRPE